MSSRMLRYICGPDHDGGDNPIRTMQSMITINPTSPQLVPNWFPTSPKRALTSPQRPVPLPPMHFQALLERQLERWPSGSDTQSKSTKGRQGACAKWDTERHKPKMRENANQHHTSGSVSLKRTRIHLHGCARIVASGEWLAGLCRATTRNAEGTTRKRLRKKITLPRNYPDSVLRHPSGRGFATPLGTSPWSPNGSQNGALYGLGW